MDRGRNDIFVDSCVLFCIIISIIFGFMMGMGLAMLIGHVDHMCASNIPGLAFELSEIAYEQDCPVCPECPEMPMNLDEAKLNEVCVWKPWEVGSFADGMSGDGVYR